MNTSKLSEPEASVFFLEFISEVSFKFNVATDSDPETSKLPLITELPSNGKVSPPPPPLIVTNTPSEPEVVTSTPEPEKFNDCALTCVNEPV